MPTSRSDTRADQHNKNNAAPTSVRGKLNCKPKHAALERWWKTVHIHSHESPVIHVRQNIATGMSTACFCRAFENSSAGRKQGSVKNESNSTSVAEQCVGKKLWNTYISVVCMLCFSSVTFAVLECVSPQPPVTTWRSLHGDTAAPGLPGENPQHIPHLDAMSKTNKQTHHNNLSVTRCAAAVYM